MRLYRRSGGTWNQLGSTYRSGALAAGSQLQIQGRGQYDLAAPERHLADLGHRHDADRRRAGHRRLRQERGGQLDRRRRAHVLGRRDRVRPVRQRGPAGQRRRQPDRRGQRLVHLRHQGRQRRRLRGHRQDQPRPGRPAPSANGSGTIGSANVTNVAVTCTTKPSTYSVGGTVSGLSGSVVLQDNGGDNLTVAANGSFTFATKLASGAAYAVTVQTNPAGQTCTVASGSGTIASANVTNVAVTCTTNAPSTYSVGGTVSGLSGTVVLQDNGGDNLTVTANGTFTFATKLASGAAYAVTVQTNPAGQTCTVASGSGTIASANVTNVAVDLHGERTVHLLGRRHRLRPVRQRGPAGQRRRQPDRDRQRPVHLRHQAGQRALPTPSPSRPSRPGRPAPSPAARARSARPTSPTSRSPARPTRPTRSAAPSPGCPGAWSCRTTAATT